MHYLRSLPAQKRLHCCYQFPVILILLIQLNDCWFWTVVVWLNYYEINLFHLQAIDFCLVCCALLSLVRFLDLFSCLIGLFILSYCFVLVRSCLFAMLFVFVILVVVGLDKRSAVYKIKQKQLEFPFKFISIVLKTSIVLFFVFRVCCAANFLMSLSGTEWSPQTWQSTRILCCPLVESHWSFHA